MLPIIIAFGFLFTVILIGIGIEQWNRYDLEYLVKEKNYINIIAWCLGGLIMISLTLLVVWVVGYCIWAFMYAVYIFITI